MRIRNVPVEFHDPFATVGGSGENYRDKTVIDLPTRADRTLQTRNLLACNVFKGSEVGDRRPRTMNPHVLSGEGRTQHVWRNGSEIGAFAVQPLVRPSTHLRAFRERDYAGATLVAPTTGTHRERQLPGVGGPDLRR